MNKEQTFTVAPVTENDIAALCRIENACFSEPWSENSLRELLTLDYAVSFAAQCEGKTVGYISMYVSFETGSVNNVGVLPEYRRQGIARALAERLIACGREKDLEVITLEVRASNRAAIALYESLGFEKVGVRRNFYRKPCEDAVLYDLTLKKPEAF